MNLISKKEKISRFDTPSGILIGFERGKLERGDGGFGGTSLNEGDCLSNKIHDNLREELRTEPFSKVMEGIVFRSLIIGEPVEEGETTIETKLGYKLSFRESKTKIDKQNCLEEGDWVIFFSARSRSLTSS